LYIEQTFKVRFIRTNRHNYNIFNILEINIIRLYRTFIDILEQSYKNRI